MFGLGKIFGGEKKEKADPKEMDRLERHLNSPRAPEAATTAQNVDNVRQEVATVVAPNRPTDEEWRAAMAIVELVHNRRYTYRPGDDRIIASAAIWSAHCNSSQTKELECISNQVMIARVDYLMKRRKKHSPDVDIDTGLRDILHGSPEKMQEGLRTLQLRLQRTSQSLSRQQSNDFWLAFVARLEREVTQGHRRATDKEAIIKEAEAILRTITAEE